MSYRSGRLPEEHASKLGHMKMVENEHLRQLLLSFEEDREPGNGTRICRSGTIDLSIPSPIGTIIVVDGGEAIISHEIRRGRRLVFIKVSVLRLQLSDLAYLSRHPVSDPREVSKLFEDAVWYQPALLPLSGVHLPGETMRETLRQTVHAVLEYTSLYDVLAYLVFRRWQPGYIFDPRINPEAPHMDCLSCGQPVYLPKDALHFECPACGYSHHLSDYLGIAQRMPVDWSREEAAIDLRNVLETLSLFHFVMHYYIHEPEKLGTILFLKDGPLLLRAQLGRLVEPIRSLVATIARHNAHIHLVGTEKNGDLVDHAATLREPLSRPGDFFIPSVQYLLEDIAGICQDLEHYRNRAQYGAKVVVRLGPHHLLPVDIPTGPFLMSPAPEDLIGFIEHFDLRKNADATNRSMVVPVHNETGTDRSVFEAACGYMRLLFIYQHGC